MKLVIVESPAKCQKIQGYLGEGYKVVATMGHIRALEESLNSVGIERNWDPAYAEIKTKKEAIAKLRAAAKGAQVILATDDDREGEGIAWHVCFILKLNPATTPRIVFHEITRPAILSAAANPKLLDMNKVNAQQARAMLDLLVGFTISRVLWNRVAPKLSAGRCQTPALRLVVERDQEVENHRAAAFWRLSALFTHAQKQIQGKADNDIPTEKEATDILQKVHKNTKATILAVKDSVSVSQPPKPLITSTLQQEASNLFGLNPKTTMQAAQKLYEAGHITYMRTDNPLISLEAAQAVRAYVKTTYGEQFVGSEGQHTIQPNSNSAPKEKKTKAAKTAEKGHEDPKGPKGPEAQAAHEAIRPTHPETPDPNIEDAVQKKIYTLIWRRATQCQMSPSETDVRKASLELDADKGRLWTIEQTKLKFAGYKILENNDKAKQEEEQNQWQQWQILKPNLTIDWKTLNADESFTKPKGRYTEASLIAELEKRGIGRPSTFATLVSTIVERDYVEKTNVEGKQQDSHHLQIKPNVWPPKQTTESHKVGAEKNKMRATSLGKSVTTYLDKEYSDLFAYAFTAKMEQNLDEISKGEKPWKSLLQETWDTYKERYAEHTSGNSAVNKAARERQLSPTIKVILSRKGPLFVKEQAQEQAQAQPAQGKAKAKQKAEFAPLPKSASFESATLREAEQAFADAQQAKKGELIGLLETEEIRKKKGPYGLYVECKGVRVPIKGEESVEQIQEKLIAKISFQTTEQAYTRQVGDFTIKKGPYGLYFYKHALKRVSFVSFPKDLDPDKVNAVDLQGLYTAGLKKKKFVKKNDTPAQ